MKKGLRPPAMPADEDAVTLTISPEKVCFIIIKAREFDAKEEANEPDPGSNPSDDKEAAVVGSENSIRWIRDRRRIRT
jgi:hypothetical protein